MADASAFEGDIAAMLAPIEGDAPAGVDLREDFTPQSIYYRLRDARAEARAAERAQDNDSGVDAVVPAQWRTVRDLATQALTGKTKDLEIAAWLTEALVRSDGVTGLAAGAALLAGLTEAFWDANLYPMPDEDGIVTRVAPITGLNGEGNDGTLIQPLRKQPVFNRPDGSPVALWQYQQSEQLGGIGDAARIKQRIAAGVRPFADTDKEARAAGAAHFARTRAEVRAAQAAWNRMGEALDARAGSDSPPTGRVRDLLAALFAIVNRYAPPEAAAPTETEADAPAVEAAGDAVSSLSALGAPAQRLVTRDDMLRELARIAEYFRRTEPHSPLSYSLDDAVRRGKMSWPELLAEVVPDAAAQRAILINLGIWPAKPDAPPA